MKFYLVGGAVRDKLLGLPIKERDFVVVNASPQDMLTMGYKQVGKEFPVFLHPKTHEEYALARTERKISPGYTGFSFDTSKQVTLEEDLIRRDLTINAMAETETGELIDPFHGKEDLRQKLLRHVSPAFAEDPVRLLRVARFLARYYHLGFRIADETCSLMKNMVANGEINALVAERVWKEWERALGEKNPEQFFLALAQCHALPVLFPALRLDSDGLSALKIAADLNESTLVRFAVLMHDLPKETILSICQCYRVPNHFRELAILTAQYYPDFLKSSAFTAKELTDLFYALDVFRREQRFYDLLKVCNVLAVYQEIDFQPIIFDKCVKELKSNQARLVKKLQDEGQSGQSFAIGLRVLRQELIISMLQSLGRDT